MNQYGVFVALMAGAGPRDGEALAIQINGDPDKVTTLSKDCRVLHIRTIILQDGTEQGTPKSEAGIREIDIHPDLAELLQGLIGERTSGYLFQTQSGNPILYSNLIKNVLDPILWDQERPVMKREGKGWKKVGVKIIPGVVGKKEDFQDKAGGRTGYGTHSFRRFRETYLRLEGVPQPIIDFWLGHGKKTISDVYTKVKGEANKRRDWCEKAGLGFSLPKAGKVVAVNSKKGKVKAA